MWMRLDTYLIMFLCSFNLLGPGVCRIMTVGRISLQEILCLSLHLEVQSEQFNKASVNQ